MTTVRVLMRLFLESWLVNWKSLTARMHNSVQFLALNPFTPALGDCASGTAFASASIVKRWIIGAVTMPTHRYIRGLKRADCHFI